MSLKERLKPLGYRLLARSLRAAAREQGLDALAGRLEREFPDLTHQYTSFSLDTDYLRLKVRLQHAFQIRLAGKALQGGETVVDIGDSAGTHIRYLNALFPDPRRRCLSLNLDPAAVRKIRALGLEAIESRAEDLASRGVDADVFLCFETLEHLSDPIRFLHDLSARTRCRALVLSVPYVARSRLGLHHIRAGLKKPVGAETTHLFELCPRDLRLLFKHAGWRVAEENVYLQYPRFSWLRVARALWKRYDFEGFYGAVLERDPSWSSLYADW